MDNLIQNIKSKLNDLNYYFISNEIEHGLALHEFIPNFHYICLNHNDIVDLLKNEGISVFCMKDEVQNCENVRTSAQILEYLIENNIFKFQKGDCFQTFKISPQFEKLVSDINGRLVNTTSEMNSKFEEKISQRALFAKYGIHTPKQLITNLHDESYSSLSKSLGNNFVVQFNRGHTGSSTVFVKSSEDFDSIKKSFPHRDIVASQLISGKTYTFNACMTKGKAFAGGLSEQITGVYELTSAEGGTVGNNFSHGLNDQVIEKILDELRKIEQMLKENSYLGMFGIDLVYDGKEIFIIEMNARQPMSIPFFCRLQLMNNQIPLNILHIATYLDIDLGEMLSDNYSYDNLQQMKAGQLFLRNKSSKDIPINSNIPTGEYSFNNFKHLNNKYLIDQISKENYLLLTQSKGNMIKANGEVARIQVLDDLMDNGEVKSIYLDILTSSGIN